RFLAARDRERVGALGGRGHLVDARPSRSVQKAGDRVDAVTAVAGIAAAARGLPARDELLTQLRLGRSCGRASLGHTFEADAGIDGVSTLGAGAGFAVVGGGGLAQGEL